MEKELAESLKDFYPEASDEMIEYYIHLIEDGEQEKLPPTKTMIDFAKKKKEYDNLESEIESLKQQIIKEKERIGHNFQLVNVTSSSRRSFKQDKFYDWVSGIVSPEILEELTIRTIDTTKFVQLEAKKKIVYDAIPAECLEKSPPTWSVSLARDKESKKRIAELD